VVEEAGPALVELGVRGAVAGNGEGGRVFEGDGGAETPFGEGDFRCGKHSEAVVRLAAEGDGGRGECDVLAGVEHSGLPGLSVAGVQREIVLCGAEAA